MMHGFATGTEAGSEAGSAAKVFRLALFAAAASLAAYIPFKYGTQLHAISGIYAVLFPLSAVLAVAGMILAVRPQKACDCSTALRGGLVSLSGLWLVTGLLCVSALAETTAAQPLRGSIATFHMIAQHVFLSLSLIAFAVAPRRMAAALGARRSMEGVAVSPTTGAVPPGHRHGEYPVT